MEEVNKKTQTKISTAFLLTLNQPDRFDNLRDYISKLKNFQYGIAAKETAPETGHKHIHLFVQFSKSCRLSIKKLEGAHVDKCYGTPQENKKYVEKDGNVIWENGTMKPKGWPSIREVEALTKYQRKDLPFQYSNLVRKLDMEEESNLTVNTMYKNVKVYYISGRSGIGKTKFAKFLIGDKPFNLVKYENGFWIGVKSGEKVALYDDWRDTHMRPSEFLNFVDYNKQIMNTKGSYITNSYELIVITSIFKLEDIYENIHDESRYQWERRIREIHLCIYKNKDRENAINRLFKNIIIYIKLIIFNKLNE